MKTIIITCDACDKALLDEYIEIGAQEEFKLQFKNTLTHKKLGEKISIENQETLHFCSREHFVQFFFGTDNKL